MLPIMHCVLCREKRKTCSCLCCLILMLQTHMNIKERKLERKQLEALGFHSEPAQETLHQNTVKYVVKTSVMSVGYLICQQTILISE